MAGRYVSSLFSLNPYLGLSGAQGRSVWGMIGFGTGTLEIADDAAEQAEKGGLVHTSLAAGVNGALLAGDDLIPGGTTTVKLKAEVSTSAAEVAGTELLEALATRAVRLRLALEGSYAHPLGDGTSITPALELGVRRDAGGGARTAGLEVGGSLSYRYPAWGLTAEGRGRVLFGHSASYREWGAGGLVRFTPDALGRGLTLRLQPTVGHTASGVERLWQQGLVRAAGAAGGRIDAQLGYGFAVPGSGVLTPYGGVSLAEDARRYQVGARLELGSAVQVSLAGERRETAAGAAHPRVTLSGRLRLPAGGHDTR